MRSLSRFTLPREKLSLKRASLILTALLLLLSAHCTAPTPEESTLAPVTVIAASVQVPSKTPLVNPENHRYFTDSSGIAIYLTGSHTWANLQDVGSSNPPPDFDYTAYLDFLQENHHNFFRLWMWEQAKGAPWTAGDDIWFTPLPYARTGPGTALDGNLKFDLAEFDQAYFDRMRSRVIEAGRREIYVSIMLFDGWSVGKKLPNDPGNPWPGHPYQSSNNINGIDGDTDNDTNGYETQNLSIPAVTALQEAYVRKVINTVNDLDNVFYEICNECNADSTAWQYHMINFIHDYELELPKQHPVGMTVNYPDGKNQDLFDSPADWISPNSDGGYKDNPPVADGSKVILVDTDHLWGEGGDHQWVWKSFTRGYNVIYMDCYTDIYCETYPPDDPTRLSVISNMGYTLEFAEQMDMTSMLPRPDLCSTEYCLADLDPEQPEFLVYLPEGGTVTVDLSNISGRMAADWFDPQSGLTIQLEEAIRNGEVLSFTAPFPGDAVLHIYGAGT